MLSSGARKGALEVFKFGVYLFVPFIVMVAYGSPEWYKKNVLPYKEHLLPKETETYKPPMTHTGVTAELQRLKAERQRRKEAKSTPD